MTHKWNISGTYFEACNCEAACPCVFLSPPTEGDCKAVVGWHIENGKYGDVHLDGLNVALFVHSPGNMVEGNWKIALYLDDTADQEQKDGLTQIFSGQAGGHFASMTPLIDQVLGVASLPIDYQAEGKRRYLKISGVAEAEIEAQAGQGDAEITVTNHPLAIAPGQPAVVARSKRAHYHDHGIELEVSGRNGLYSPFNYQGQ